MFNLANHNTIQRLFWDTLDSPCVSIINEVNNELNAFGMRAETKNNTCRTASSISANPACSKASKNLVRKDDDK